ncbi:hypothetical protein A8F94_23935 [Bacillus sp. FJAT-27225]|uniref:hypothetical protein n=1 Tax=Bacillus sp. FJAT-27225 TaxID=1743144 RepID=UPI00080C255B|nr:hypothetical protein [Bacillus sp. FJAT-27225]OCA89297.1 hypothetical protein A8F94_23935 [Bacillus sp. FJAT-27225]
MNKRVGNNDLSGDIMKFLVSKTLSKYNVDKKSLSSDEKQRLRDMVYRLKEQTDEFLAKHNHEEKIDQEMEKHTSTADSQEVTPFMHSSNNDLSLVWKPGKKSKK